MDDLAAGFPRFAWGLCKKVLIADSVAAVADVGFALPAGELTFAGAWVATLAFAVQIYFDFSGYSDMAIGLGRMFGFHLPENFDRPYAAESVTEFWRRWHMSLSRWFRDYVYLPLGGNRRGAHRTYVNLGTVFLLTGIWHGAGLTFVLWGAYHGFWLILERVRGFAPAAPNPRRRPQAQLTTLVIVCMGWALFRAPNVSIAADVIGNMLNPFGGLTLGSSLGAAITSQRLMILAVGVASLLLPRRAVLGPWLDDAATPVAGVSRILVSTIGVAYAGALAASGTFSPFLYFRF